MKTGRPIPISRTSSRSLKRKHRDYKVELLELIDSGSILQSHRRCSLPNRRNRPHRASGGPSVRHTVATPSTAAPAAAKPPVPGPRQTVAPVRASAAGRKGRESHAAAACGDPRARLAAGLPVRVWPGRSGRCRCSATIAARPWAAAAPPVSPTTSAPPTSPPARSS